MQRRVIMTNEFDILYESVTTFENTISALEKNAKDNQYHKSLYMINVLNNYLKYFSFQMKILEYNRRINYEEFREIYSKMSLLYYNVKIINENLLNKYNVNEYFHKLNTSYENVSKLFVI